MALADKTGLGAILARVEALAAEQHEAVRVVKAARRNQGFEHARTELAVGDQELKRAQEEWQRISAEVNRAYNER